MRTLGIFLILIGVLIQITIPARHFNRAMDEIAIRHIPGQQLTDQTESERADTEEFDIQAPIRRAGKVSVPIFVLGSLCIVSGLFLMTRHHVNRLRRRMYTSPMP